MKKTTYMKVAWNIYKELIQWNINWFIDRLKSLFSGIAYSSIQNICKYEWYYTSVIYTLFYSMWLDIVQEDITNEWRIDLTLKIEQKIFIIELKVEKSWLEALEQIKEKKYFEKYLNEEKKIYLDSVK